MAGKAGFGTTISFGTGTGTVTIANVTNIAGLDGDTEVIDVTAHDSGSAYREKIASFIDLGQVTLDLNFDPNKPSHKAITGGLLYLQSQRTVETFTVTFPGTPVHKVVFSAFVKNAGFEAPFDDKLAMSVTLEVTGSAAWTYGT
jgi:predicted secreted protein